MVIPFASKHHRFIIELTIMAVRPLSMGIILFDPSVPNTHYFRRRVSFDSNDFRDKKTMIRTIEIPMPVSPQNLALEIYNKHTGGDDDFQIKNIKAKTMPTKQVWASGEHHRFMDFAIDFAQKAGYVKPGFYDSKNYEFLIQYLPTITDELGGELVTPARISRHVPRVQLSQKLFKQFSIPVRVAILSHEGCHFFKNTRSEKKGRSVRYQVLPGLWISNHRSSLCYY